jgi:hypothetical protein
MRKRKILVKHGDPDYRILWQWITNYPWPLRGQQNFIYAIDRHVWLGYGMGTRNRSGLLGFSPLKANRRKELLRAKKKSR